jgi:hypothetical protein
MVHAVCERCGEVERKRRSDARTTGGGGGGGKVVPPIKKQRTTTHHHHRTAECRYRDWYSCHGVVDIDDPIMLHLPDELTTTTTTTTTRTHQNDTIATDDIPKHPDDDVYAMTPV